MKMPDFHAIILSVQASRFIGRAVVHFREKIHMSQPALATAANVGLCTLKRLEKGRKRGGSCAILESLCGPLGITVPQLHEYALHLARVEALQLLFVKNFKVAF